MSFAKTVKKFAFSTFLLTVTSALLAQTNTIESGKTTVSLSSGFVTALSDLSVTPGTIGPTTISGAVATFPAVAGALDVNNAKGQILHSGGLTLADSKARVRLQSFIVDTTGSSPVITGIVVVNGVFVGRMTLFNLHLPSGLSLPLKPSGDVLTLSNVGVTLSSGAASALNKVFAVSAFTGGLKIGTAKVSVMVNPDTGM